MKLVSSRLGLLSKSIEGAAEGCADGFWEDEDGDADGVAVDGFAVGVAVDGFAVGGVGAEGLKERDGATEGCAVEGVVDGNVVEGVVDGNVVGVEGATEGKEAVRKELC
jgi:hypothetical protein